MTYSQNSSALCPYDGDIWLKKLENRKIEGRTGRKPETPRACQYAGRREKSVFQGKKWQCQRYMVIVCSANYSENTSNSAQGVAA